MGILSKYLVPVWACLNGALLAFCLVFFVQSKFIALQVEYIVRSVTTPDMSTQQRALALLRESHAIVDFGMRHNDSAAPEIIQRLPVRSFDESILLPATGCGDAAGILFRLLSAAGIGARIGQMRCGDLDGCHIFVEGNIDGRWVVLDPLVGVAFRNEYNQLATFGEISANWPLFRQQVPAEFAEKYNFDGVQYTNWEKIPVLMPFLRRLLVAVLGEDRTSGISLRSYFMAPNRLYLAICLAGLVLVNGTGVALGRRRSAQRSIKPAALPNSIRASLLS